MMIIETYIAPFTIYCVMQDAACAVYRRVCDASVAKGHCFAAVASACLYLACRQENVPRTFKGCHIDSFQQSIIYLLAEV